MQFVQTDSTVPRSPEMNRNSGPVELCNAPNPYEVERAQKNKQNGSHALPEEQYGAKRRERSRPRAFNPESYLRLNVAGTIGALDADKPDASIVAIPHIPVDRVVSGVIGSENAMETQGSPLPLVRDPYPYEQQGDAMQHPQERTPPGKVGALGFRAIPAPRREFKARSIFW